MACDARSCDVDKAVLVLGKHLGLWGIMIPQEYCKRNLASCHKYHDWQAGEAGEQVTNVLVVLSTSRVAWACSVPGFWQHQGLLQVHRRCCKY